LFQLVKFSELIKYSNTASCLTMEHSIATTPPIGLALAQKEENVLSATLYTLCLQQHKSL